MSTAERLRGHLDAVYARYNRPEFIHPDPLAPVLGFADPRDQEVVALVAASLAFGNVKSILTSIDRILQLTPHPYRDLLDTPDAEIERGLRHFRHRYVAGPEMADLLIGMRHLLHAQGSLGHAFAAGLRPEDTTVVPALIQWVDALRPAGSPSRAYLLSDPRRGSTCKRLFMYLRWMVRQDDVDLGLWPGVPASLLVIPLDTHMFRMAHGLRLTQRKTAALPAALEVTARFRKICPEDPVRYDFALTRLGIRREESVDDFIRLCRSRPSLRPPAG